MSEDMRGWPAESLLEELERRLEGCPDPECEYCGENEAILQELARRLGAAGYRSARHAGDGARVEHREREQRAREARRKAARANEREFLAG